MTISPDNQTTPHVHNRTHIVLVLGTLALGLALGPGYLLLCSHTSGVKVTDLSIVCTPGTDANSADRPVLVALGPDMNRIGFNIIITTPFRNYKAAEAGPYTAELSQDGRTLWTTSIHLSHGRQKEAIAGTTFSVRAKTFHVTQAGEYAFMFRRPSGMDGITGVHLEVRKNVLLPRTWVLAVGFLLIAAVIVWAILPHKGYDPVADRTGTKWYAD